MFCVPKYYVSRLMGYNAISFILSSYTDNPCIVVLRVLLSEATNSFVTNFLFKSNIWRSIHNCFYTVLVMIINLMYLEITRQ